MGKYGLNELFKATEVYKKIQITLGFCLIMKGSFLNGGKG